MNFESQPEVYNLLKPNEEVLHQTYVGHYWRLSDPETEAAYCYFQAAKGLHKVVFNGSVFSPSPKKTFDELHRIKSDQVLRMSEDPAENQPSFLIIKQATRSRIDSSCSTRNSVDAMQQELNREREENEKLKEMYNKIMEEKE